MFLQDDAGFWKVPFGKCWIVFCERSLAISWSVLFCSCRILRSSDCKYCRSCCCRVVLSVESISKQLLYSVLSKGVKYFSIFSLQISVDSVYSKNNKGPAILVGIQFWNAVHCLPCRLVFLVAMSSLISCFIWVSSSLICCSSVLTSSENCEL